MILITYNVSLILLIQFLKCNDFMFSGIDKVHLRMLEILQSNQSMDKSRMLSIGHKIVQGSRLTVGAVFILGSINGAIRLHLQLEALSTGEPGHNPLQLGLWEEKRRHISCLHPLLLSCD